MAASKTVGGINVTISASTQKFVKGVNIARRALAGLWRGITNFVFSMKGLAVAFAGGMFLKFASDAAEGIAALGDLSDKTGVATERLAGYQLAAEEAGISSTVLAKSLTILSAKGMTLSGWVKQTEQLSTHQERLNAAIAMFGTKGADMVRLATAGSGALVEAQQAADSLGLALDRKTVAGVDRAMEAFARFKTAVSGIMRSLVAEIAPFIEALSVKATSFLATNGRGAGIGKAIADSIEWMVSTVADLIQKMVAGVLGMVADVRGAMLTFRDSKLGGKMGFEIPTVEEFTAVGEMRNTAFWLRHENNLPSKAIAKAKEAASKAAEAAAAAAPSNNKPSLVSRAVKNVLSSPTVGNARDFGGQLWDKVQALPGMMRDAQWAGMKFALAGGGRRDDPHTPQSRTPTDRPSLSFAEAGSADSYRQQAAIRRQADAIPKQQLAVQKEMRDGIKQIANAPPMRPANFN